VYSRLESATRMYLYLETCNRIWHLRTYEGIREQERQIPPRMTSSPHAQRPLQSVLDGPKATGTKAERGLSAILNPFRGQ